MPRRKGCRFPSHPAKQSFENKCVTKPELGDEGNDARPLLPAGFTPRACPAYLPAVSTKRFRIAFSFAGEKREFVSSPLSCTFR